MSYRTARVHFEEEYTMGHDPHHVLLIDALQKLDTKLSSLKGLALRRNAMESITRRSELDQRVADKAKTAHELLLEIMNDLISGAYDAPDNEDIVDPGMTPAGAAPDGLGAPDEYVGDFNTFDRNNP